MKCHLWCSVYPYERVHPNFYLPNPIAFHFNLATKAATRGSVLTTVLTLPLVPHNVQIHTRQCIKFIN